MKCDHLGCTIPPLRAPRLIVFSTKPFEPDHRPLRMMTTLHYCELHKGELTVADVLTPKIKREMEGIASRARPIGFKPDFEKAILEFVLVTTPEYRQFLKDLGHNAILALART